MRISVHTKLGVLVLSMALGAAGWAAPKGDHPEGVRDGPPPNSNRQSLPDADRGLDRAEARRAEEALEHSRAQEQEHPPARDEHRNERSAQEHGPGKRGH